MTTPRYERRRFLSQAAWSGLFLSVPGAFAEQLKLTPAQAEGPFYPDKMPLDTDNDLLAINNAITPAVGEVAWVTGRILDSRGDPLRNATVEIWQCDANGAYLHSKTSNREKRDVNFQGFGRFVTGSRGDYGFRTIKPVPYPGRTPHIHFQVGLKGREKFTTQLYVQGHPGNEKDGLYSRTDPKDRPFITVPFTPLAGSRIGELSAKFDIVLGVTPSAA